MLKQTQGHATKCRSARSDSHPRSHTGGRWLRQGIPASRCPLEIGVDKRCGLALVAGEQMAVAIESDRDRRVFHVGRQGLHVDTGGYEHTGSGMAASCNPIGVRSAALQPFRLAWKPSSSLTRTWVAQFRSCRADHPRLDFAPPLRPPCVKTADSSGFRRTETRFVEVV
jgi:hypothetical protein